jgi:hypothetical protein
MHNSNMNIFINIIVSLMGFCMIIFNKAIANWTVEFYYKTRQIRYKIESFRFGFYLVGTLFIIFAILSFIHVIKYQ